MVGCSVRIKKWMCVVLTAALMLSLCCCGEKKGASENSDNSAANIASADYVVENTEGASDDAFQEPEMALRHSKVEIVIKDYGTIQVELYDEVAPITVANFLKLVDEQFYDGLTFHRIINGFMMQGGDPTGTGAGGLDEKITGEFAANGVENDLSHLRGAISMARTKDYNSASCQFFIVHKDYPSLDGSYAVFGYVTEGIEVVDQICENTPVQDNNGKVAAEDQPVIETIRRME